MRNVGLLFCGLALFLAACVEQKPQTAQTQVQRTIVSSFISYPPSSRPAGSGGEAGKITLVGEMKEFQGDCGIRLGFDNQTDLKLEFYEIAYRATLKNGETKDCKDEGRLSEGGVITCDYVEPTSCDGYSAFVITKFKCPAAGAPLGDCLGLSAVAGTPLLSIAP